MDDLKKLVPEVQKAFGDNLVSIISFGNKGFGHALRKHAGLLLVINKLDHGILRKSQKLFKLIKGKTKTDPLIMAEDMIISSTDILPIEFFIMKDDYNCVQGKDIFAKLEINKTNLKFSCECSLRSKLIVLQQLLWKGHREDHLLKESMPAIIEVICSLLKTKSDKLPESINEVLDSVKKAYSTDTEIFKVLYEQLRVNRIDKKHLQQNFSQYLEQLSVLVNKISIEN